MKKMSMQKNLPLMVYKLCIEQGENLSGKQRTSSGTLLSFLFIIEYEQTDKRVNERS